MNKWKNVREIMKICDRCGCKIMDYDEFAVEWREFVLKKRRVYELCHPCRMQLLKKIDSFIKNAP